LHEHSRRKQKQAGVNGYRIKTQFKNNKQGWTSKLMTPKGVNTPYNGSYMNSKLGDVKVNNKSLETFYGDKIKP